MADDIRELSTRLARDPGSLVYSELAEALRRGGQRDEALRVVQHGLSRNPQHADGYDCLARIQADLSDLAEARAAWERALAIDPEHTGALKGIAFLYYRQGDAKRAADVLEHALAADPTDAAAQRALAMVRGSAPAAAPAESSGPAARSASVAERGGVASGTGAEELPPVFSGLEGATADILLLDARGLVVAGGLKSAGGTDASELAAAALAGVSGEASRTASYLGLGGWNAIVAEADTANLVLAPVGDGALLMVRRDKSIPVGLALRFAERARGAASRWLAGQGA